LLLVMLIGFTLIPVGGSLEIRGWTEMHPLNGPAWTLFFEYIGNVLYGLFVRKFSKTLLAILVILAGAALVHLSVKQGDVIGGWSVAPEQLRIGFTRLLYPFFAGLLLSRLVKPGKIKNAFLWCSLLLIIVFAVPRIGGYDHKWMNGLYVAVSIIFIFPLIVYMGASGKVTGKFSSKLCRFLGDISYPIYIIHYPFIYMYTAWVVNNRTYLEEASAGAILTLVLVSVLTLVVSIAVAWVSFKFYDVPVRNWLAKRLMKSQYN